MLRHTYFLALVVVVLFFGSPVLAQRFEIAVDDAQFVDQPEGSKVVAAIARGKRIYGLELIKKTGWVKAVEPTSQLPAWISLRKLRLIKNTAEENARAKELSEMEDRIWAVRPMTIKQYRQSLELVAEIRDIRGDLYPTTPDFVDNAASVARNVRMFEKSEELYKLGVRMNTAIFGKDSLEAAKSKERLAGLLADVGRNSDTLRIIREVRRVYVRNYGEDDPRTARLAIPFGDIHFEIDENEDAVKFYRMALPVFRKHYGDQDSRTTGLAIRTARVLAELGSREEATALFRRTIKDMEGHKGADAADLAGHKLRLAVLELKPNDPDQLERIIDQLANFKAEYPAESFVAKTVAESLFTHLYSVGDEQQLLNFADISIRRLRIKLRKELWGVADSQQDAMLSTAGAFTFFNAITIAATLEQEPKSAATSLEWLINGKGLVKDTRIAKTNAKGNPDARQDWVDEPYVTLAAVREKLPVNGVYVDILRYLPTNLETGNFTSQYRYLAWIAHKNGDTKIVDLGRASSIERQIKRFRKSLLESSEKKKTEGELGAFKLLEPSLKKLSEVIWQPIEKELGEAEVLLVSPDQAMWMVPWAAMLNSDETFAIEKFEIQSVVSGRELVRKVTTASDVSTIAPVVFANPDYGQKLATSDESTRRGMTLPGQFEKLRWSQQEADFVAPALKYLLGVETEVFVEKNAQEARFKSLSSPPVILFSTHGYFVDAESQIAKSNLKTNSNFNLLLEITGNPLLDCGLVLANGNQHKAIEQCKNDGILTGVEIAQANLRNTKLVVLSACETGLGSLEATGGVVGLRQAFHLAGAQSVLATLWQVDDKETAKLMRSFFQDLTEVKDVRKSLRLAQLRYIKQHRRDGAAHPYFWSAFSLTGQAKF